MADLYSNTAVREYAENLVRQNVNYCVSTLVSSIAESEQAREGLGIDYEDLAAILSREDYETAAIECIGNADLSDLLAATLDMENFDAEEVAAPLLRDALRHHAHPGNEDEVAALLGDRESDCDPLIDAADADALSDACDERDVDTSAARNALRAAMSAHVEQDSDDARALCEGQRIEADQIEAYEHWIIDSWFAGKLEEAGEMVARDFLGLTIWGRATTGQSIAMDAVILRIAESILNERAASEKTSSAAA